jgi:predicted metal-binding membrane protein
MTPAARGRLQVRVPLLTISAAAWMLLLIDPSGMAMPAYCAAPMSGPPPSYASLGLLLALNPPTSLASSWALMLIAMMAPLLIAPVRHVRDRSLARRRARATVLFVVGYAALWMLAGIILQTFALGFRVVAPVTLVPTTLLTIVAIVWQFSPVKQSCLNRCHAQPELAAFGTAADVDALRFGLTYGGWCVGSCWTLMLLPVLFSQAHVAAMAAVALWLFAERLDRPMPPCWRWHGPGKAIRIAIAQTRLPRRRLTTRLGFS